MGKAVFITGFSNWGKSTIIKKIFNSPRFEDGKLYHLKYIKADFIVVSQSNDDEPSGKHFIERIKLRQGIYTKQPHNILIALCPTKEGKVLDKPLDVRKIITDNIFANFDELIIVLLRYKWDKHAQLNIDEIMKHLSGISKVKIVVAENKNEVGKINEIKQLLKVRNII